MESVNNVQKNDTYPREGGVSSIQQSQGHLREKMLVSVLGFLGVVGGVKMMAKGVMKDIGNAAAGINRKFDDVIGRELSGESLDEMPNLQKKIRGYYEAREEKGYTPAHGLRDIYGIVVDASNLAKKRGGQNIEGVLQIAGANVEEMKKEVFRLLPLVRDDILSEEPGDSTNPGDPHKNIGPFLRNAPSIPTQAAEEVGQQLGIDLVEAGMDKEAINKMLIKGMDRCLQCWDKETYPSFCDSPFFDLFAKNAAELVKDKPVPRATLSAVLKDNHYEIDPPSEERLYPVVESYIKMSRY